MLDSMHIFKEKLFLLGKKITGYRMETVGSRIPTPSLTTVPIINVYYYFQCVRKGDKQSEAGISP